MTATGGMGMSISSGSKTGLSKHAVIMGNLLMRCTNTGSRGWESAMNDAIKEGEGCARVCRMALLSSLTGLHPLIHPIARCTWETRAKIYRVLAAVGDSRKLLFCCTSATKESMRLFLSALLHNMPALREALEAAKHPAGGLIMSPLCLAHTSLLAAMNNLADTGAALLRTNNPSDVFQIVKESFDESKGRSMRRTSNKASKRLPLTQAVVYNTAWLGRIQASSYRGSSLCDDVSAFCFDVFKADFVPLWLKSWESGNRLSRLDGVQHDTLQKRNPVQKLLLGISDRRRLEIQRLALCTPNANILGLPAVVELLGLPVQSEPPRGQSPLLMVEDATVAAELIHFAKVCAMGCHIVAWNLGEKTKTMQLHALARRLMVSGITAASTEDELMRRLPGPATNILFCVECKRVCNACCDHNAKNVGFNEIGVSASMFRVDGEVEDGHMRCAKRSSAALRTALQLEEEAKAAIRGTSKKQTSTALVPYDTSAVVSKLRRDCKTVFDQTGQAVSCGEQPLVCIPVLGRAVRINGISYALCSTCGCLTTVNACNRFKGDIFCGRCDPEMLLKTDACNLAKYQAQCKPIEEKRRCRFCGKPDSSTLANSKWKTVAAPLDENGPNRNIPSPLRYVTYCPSHYKPWLTAAHQSLSMEQIFAHLTNKAKPIHGAQNGKRGLSELEAVVTKTTKTRRVRSIKRKQIAN